MKKLTIYAPIFSASCLHLFTLNFGQERFKLGQERFKFAQERFNFAQERFNFAQEKFNFAQERFNFGHFSQCVYPIFL